MSQKMYKIGTGIGVIVLNKKGQVLLGHRVLASGSVFGVGDVWALPGGKVDYGETFEQAAKREIFEETGMKIKNPKVVALQTDINEQAHFTTIGLVATEYLGAPKALEPDEVDRWEWFDLDNLPEIGYFPSVKFLDKYKRGVFYEVKK